MATGLSMALASNEMLALAAVKALSIKAERAIPKDPHLAYCYRILVLVSRSFTMVIQQLSQELRDAVCVCYVVLRALDTVEDDMSIEMGLKTKILEEFYIHIQDPTWRFVCGVKHYRDLMENFHHIPLALRQLSKGYQEVIIDVTQKMGFGMAEFIRREVETVAAFDKYCYYVAGLVGVALTGLFNQSGLERLEDPQVDTPDAGPSSLSISMGRFLQKVNIIRDYLEDINEEPAPRMFWPREIWGKYAPVLEDFKDPENETAAVQCLNDMVTDCLRHAPDCLKYLSQLRNSFTFRFCAVPQIMAIATAASCYNNVQVFKGVVKIRRGITAKIMVGTQTMEDVCGAFYDFTTMLASKVGRDDPSARVTLDRVDAIYKACRQYGMRSNRRKYLQDRPSSSLAVFLLPLLLVALMVALAILFPQFTQT